ncbi:MAG: murein hydrolase transporter LrgA [Comamonadaceae bacterium SCN 68-20]|nr:MAG: murein hydrolase transporter LrgA [Comamonadaceae bacterium SCN 68-20]OJX06900.1 MAG: CidA/LrgA family protein [Burkholderiales bacterium 68-20]UJB64501.1 CidA/LrgA family protein [Acidovorax sp. YS12]
MIRALTILVVLQLVGEFLARLLHLPLPGGLIGMLLLLAALLIRGRVSPELQGTSEALLQNLMLLFIPFIAGILAQLEHVRAQWLPFVASCVLGAVLSLIATAWAFQWMLKRQERAARHDA